jgi:hypothetical protein
MRLSVMQPYLFPYVGYFQLIAAADKFVIYDDVNYIKQGWINRNRILVKGEPHMFTMPLQGASSFSPINELLLSEKHFVLWRDKFLKTLTQAYGKAPHFNPAMAVLEEVLTKPYARLVDLLAASISALTQVLRIQTEIVISSTKYANNHLTGEARILDICKAEHADHYINAIGGKALYAQDAFKAQGIQLSFLRSNTASYEQFGDPFQPGLSIIDALMFNTPERLHAAMGEYALE